MILSRYYRFADIALDLCDQNKYEEGMLHKLVALVVSKNKILSVGYNSRKTHPSMHTRMQMLHAESDAISRLSDRDLIGSDIVVVRLRPSGFPGLAKPCSFCEQSLRDVGIRKVYYTHSVDYGDIIRLSCIDLRD